MTTPTPLATGPPDPAPVEGTVPFEKPVVTETLPKTERLAHRLNRNEDLVTPIEDMLRIQNARQYVIIVIGMIQFAQIQALTGYIFLNHVQTIWGIPLTAYTLISSATVAVIVFGLPIVMGLFLRKRRGAP